MRLRGFEGALLLIDQVAMLRRGQVSRVRRESRTFWRAQAAARLVVRAGGCRATTAASATPSTITAGERTTDPAAAAARGRIGRAASKRGVSTVAATAGLAAPGFRACAARRAGTATARTPAAWYVTAAEQVGIGGAAAHGREQQQERAASEPGGAGRDRGRSRLEN